MEKINKHNYEAFFLDYIEGNLTADQQNDLFLFLAENPELKAEFEGGFEDLVLSPEKNTFDKKASLKVVDDSLLTLNNVDVWMIESVEGNLISSKEKELQEFIKKHKLEKTFATYHATILQPNREEIYANKKGLKVPSGIIIPLYVRVASIAAVGIILISVALNNFGNDVDSTTGVANKNVVNSTNIANLSFRTNPSADGEESNLPDLTQAPNQNSNFANNKLERERNNQNNSDRNQDQNNLVNLRDNLFSFQNDDNKKQDTTNNFVPPFDDKKHDIVINIQDSLPKNDDIIPVLENEDVVTNTKRSEQPYKLITDLASNITNREISFSRDKDLASNEYVGYQFKLGSFEFERKK